MFILHKVHWMAISMLNFLSPQNVFRSEIRIRLRDLRKWWLNDIPPRPPNRARLAEIKLHMIPRMIRSIALPDAGKYIRVKLTRWLIFPLLTIDPEKENFAKKHLRVGFSWDAWNPIECKDDCLNMNKSLDFQDQFRNSRWLNKLKQTRTQMLKNAHSWNFRKNVYAWLIKAVKIIAHCIHKTFRKIQEICHAFFLKWHYVRQNDITCMTSQYILPGTVLSCILIVIISAIVLSIVGSSSCCKICSLNSLWLADKISDWSFLDADWTTTNKLQVVRIYQILIFSLPLNHNHLNTRHEKSWNHYYDRVGRVLQILRFDIWLRNPNLKTRKNLF